MSTLQQIQTELKAPKSQRNSFGNYNYRSLEDIMEALKPLLEKHNASLIVGDSIELVGDRFYIKATAKLYDESMNVIGENTAYAREELSKKGMDASQITGATSSYARKYCLNGLFCIDDTKDADSMDNTKHETKQQVKLVTEAQAKEIADLAYRTGSDYDKLLKFAQCNDLTEMTFDNYTKVKEMLLKKVK